MDSGRTNGFQSGRPDAQPFQPCPGSWLCPSVSRTADGAQSCPSVGKPSIPLKSRRPHRPAIERIWTDTNPSGPGTWTDCPGQMSTADCPIRTLMSRISRSSGADQNNAGRLPPTCTTCRRRPHHTRPGRSAPHHGRIGWRLRTFPRCLPFHGPRPRMCAANRCSEDWNRYISFPQPSPVPRYPGRTNKPPTIYRGK